MSEPTEQIPALIEFANIDADPEKQTEFWCYLGNARTGQRLAAQSENPMAFAYYSGALGAYVDVIGLAAPDALRPDGSETPKP